MNHLDFDPRRLTCLAVLALGVIATGCGRDPILGAPGITAVRPSVVAESPLDGATGVVTKNTSISVTFNEAVSPLGGGATMTVTCASPCVNATGTVTLDSAGTIATFALAPGTALATLTEYTATVTGVQSLAAGVAMAAPFSWRFTTAATTDATRPQVSSTVPATSIPGPTPGVPSNGAITARFTEDMAPATISASSFTLACTLPCVAPAGSVDYSVGARTAVLRPAAALTIGEVYTVMISSAVTDLAGNALGGNQAPLPAASSYVWTFTAAAPSVAGNLTVASTIPIADGSLSCPTSTISATFAAPVGTRLDPATLNPATFLVNGPMPASTPVAAASISLDAATGLVATFTPQGPLTAGVTYTATIKSGAAGVHDLAVPPDALAGDVTWSFAVVAAGPSCTAPVALGAAETFGTFGGSAGATNSGILTVINGDIGTTAASTLVTGLHDGGQGCTYTEVAGSDVGLVNGLIYTAPPAPTVACPSEGTAATMATAMQARADALTAYNALVALPGGPDPGAGNLANLVLVPGVYTAAAGSFMIQGGDLTLDAQGDANAVWVFQMATTLTVGGPGAAFPQSVILINGARAKNVHWQVGSAATINAAGGGTMIGTIISQAGAAFSTVGNNSIVTLNGRVLSLGASVTLVNTVINVPAP